MAPGRLRIALPALYRSLSEKRRLERLLAEHAPIRAAHANILTGNLLILFDPAIAPDRILPVIGLRLDATPPAARTRRLPAGASASASTSAAARTSSRIIDRAKPHGEVRSTRIAAEPTLRHRQRPPDWHAMPAAAALAFYGSNAALGLPQATAAARLRQGTNRLPPPQPRSDWSILIGQFKSLPVLLLIAAAGLSLLTGGVVEALAIGAVLALNGAIGFITERRAETTIAALSALVDDDVMVLREGRMIRLPSWQVVPGDVLVLHRGMHVAADARLIRTAELHTDESALTGESRPVPKRATVVLQTAGLAERANMVYMGTAVTGGSGDAVVVGTGQQTELGMVQALTATTRAPKTPIQKHLDRLGNQLVQVSLGACAVVFLLGLARGFGALAMLRQAISLAIAAVPEGLPTVATTSLARGVRRMREQRMLVRHLQAVETLGAMHILCMDKTGTLTLNRMAVTILSSGPHRYRLADDGALHGRGGRLVAAADPGIRRLLEICVLSNEEAVRGNLQDGSSGSISATESALMKTAQDAGIDAVALRAACPLVQGELRDTGRNYMLSLHETTTAGRRLIAVKGNPIEVLALCDRRMWEGRIAPLDAAAREVIAQENERMARQQLRVLGFACAEVAEQADPADPANDVTGRPAQAALVWVGLAGLADVMRPGARHVIARLHAAGIRTAMLTGDQRTTAAAMGGALGLQHGKDLHVLDAQALAGKPAGLLAHEVVGTEVFARVSPAHKLQIVQVLQTGGEVVGMVGDGINDGPALRAADVGIVMGKGGTGLARSAADVVLEEDELASILEAIRHGRTITRNIERSLHFLISSNLSEILLVLVAIAAGLPAPLTPLQLLWLNLLGDVMPAIALAAEPVETDLMRQPPRDAHRPLIDRAALMQYGTESLLLAGGALAGFGYGLARHGRGAEGSAGSIAFNTLVIGQLLHALICGTRCPDPQQGASLLKRSVGGSIGVQVVANLLPGLRRLLGLGRLDVLDLIVILAGAGLPLLFNSRSTNRMHGAARTPTAPEPRTGIP